MPVVDQGDEIVPGEQTVGRIAIDHIDSTRRQSLILHRRSEGTDRAGMKTVYA